MSDPEGVPESPSADWAPPIGAAAPDPDPGDERELASMPPGRPAAVVVVAGEPPVAGRPWTVRAHTAAGVSGLSLEIEGRAHDVRMRPESPGGIPPTWIGTVDEIGDVPLRYRFAWRSSWNGDVTDWQAVTPSPADDDG